MDQHSLINLFKRYKQGDRNSLELLCKNAEQFMRGYFKRKFSDIEIVNDLCQETFVRLMSSFDQINEPMKFKSFVLKIAFHVMQDYFRQKYRHETVDYLEDESDLENPSKHHVFNPDNPESVIPQMDMDKAISSLPQKSQQIVQLYSQGFKLNEIARNLTLSESAVKMQIKRSLEKLRISLFIVTFLILLRL